MKLVLDPRGRDGPLRHKVSELTDIHSVDPKGPEGEVTSSSSMASGNRLMTAGHAHLQVKFGRWPRFGSIL